MAPIKVRLLLFPGPRGVQYVPHRKPRSAAKGGPYDAATGRRVYEETGESYINKQGKLVKKQTKTTRMAEATDARKLSSGTLMEGIYAQHANELKAMANDCRKRAISTPAIKRDPGLLRAMPLKLPPSALN